MMPANEDKENNIVYTGNESSGINFPQTPAHLLKRSHSNILKPPVRLDQLKRDANSNNGNTLKYIQGGKEVSPTKRLHTHAQQQGRLPLAAKDNNRSKSFIFPETFNQSKDADLPQLQNTLSIRKNDQLRKLSQISRSRSRANHNDLLSNSRKLQKYGSVLGYNALPKMKSLVLKDLADSGKNEESSDDDEGNEDSESKLGKKLQSALLKQDSSDGENELNGGLGLFNEQGGLQQLIKNSTKNEQKTKNDKSDKTDDYDIEIAPQRQEPLPYVPEGYSPFQQDDIEKLKTFNSPYKLDLEDEDDTPDKVDLLPLEQIDEEGEKDETECITRNQEEGAALPLLSKNFKEVAAVPTMELVYSEEGLDPEELEDLVT
ncbi:Pds1p [Saccharomyces cerevisiae YJM1478]|uniref:Pds1p n=1 Tax=Saccharomyces cerevisiae (strain CEN.PK113-7D) TaxID=889517 RepID=N1P874_YEASC